MDQTAWVRTTARGWIIGNDRLRLELRRTDAGGTTVASLARTADTGSPTPREWAHPGAATGPWVRSDGESGFRPPERIGFRLSDADTVELEGGTVELNLRYLHDTSGALLVQSLRCFPDHATIECATRLQNARGSVPAICAIAPISIALADQARLKRHVLPQPVTGTPLAAYCVWLTEPAGRRACSGS